MHTVKEKKRKKKQKNDVECMTKFMCVLMHHLLQLHFSHLSGYNETMGVRTNRRQKYLRKFLWKYFWCVMLYVCAHFLNMPTSLLLSTTFVKEFMWLISQKTVFRIVLLFRQCTRIPSNPQFTSEIVFLFLENYISGFPLDSTYDTPFLLLSHPHITL